jgi:glutamate N-acetyltransferase/amino-acid N-acetyltransferase
VSAATESFFRSRWVDPPDGVEQLDPARLAPGFRAAGVACGLKAGGNTDLGIVVSDAEEVASSLLLTRNAAAAAPIRVCRERCEADSLRAAVVNSGNANAATGEQGYSDALAMRDSAAAALGLEGAVVAVAETGVIGVPLDVESVKSGIDTAAAALSETGGEDFAAAICTTDRWSKRCTVSVDGVTISAQAKGAGMMEPGFATLLGFVQTDAVVPDAEAALRAATAASFERISVDGQMSTNDMLMLQATGASGREIPAGLLEAIMLQLALEIVADGEGATRVKTALFGRDPNWGRIAQAAGMALAGEELDELGPAEIVAEDLSSESPEAELSVALGRGDSSWHMYFSDLTYDYVKLNAEYTT